MKRDLLQAYLDATNRDDHALLRTLVVPQIELAMGTDVVEGIENVLALNSPEHLETTLLLQHVELEGETAVAMIEQRLTWKATQESADVRRVNARFYFDGNKIRRVELLG
jgi:hypothetical protein